MQQRDPLLGDQPHRVGRVELLLQHHGSATGMESADDRECTDVEHRHVDQSAIDAAATHLVVHRQHDPAHLPLSKDAALGCAGGAAGEQQVSDVLGSGHELEFAAAAAFDKSLVAGNPRRGLTADGHQRWPRRHARYEVGDHRHELLSAEHDRRGDAAQRIVHLGWREPEVDGGHDDSAELGGRVQLAELDAVAAQHRDAVLAFHPGRGHRRHQSDCPVP